MESSPSEVSEPLQKPLAVTDSSPDNMDKSAAESIPAQMFDHGQADDENLSKQEEEHPKIHLLPSSSAQPQADVKHVSAPGDTLHPPTLWDFPRSDCSAVPERLLKQSCLLYEQGFE